MITIIIIIIIAVFIQFWLIRGFYRSQEIQTDLTWLQRKRGLAEPTWHFVMWSWISQKFRHTELHRVLFIVFEPVSFHILSYAFYFQACVSVTSLPQSLIHIFSTECEALYGWELTWSSTVNSDTQKKKMLFSINFIKLLYFLSAEQDEAVDRCECFLLFFLHNDLLGIINIIVASQVSLPLWIVLLVVWLTDCFKTKLSRVVMLLCTSLHLWHYFRPGYASTQ